MVGPAIVPCDPMAAAPPLSISVHTSQLEAVDEVCGAALGCGQSDVFGQLLLLVLSGLLAVFLLAAVQHVRAARSAVAEERSRTATEQHAFDRFARAVSRLDAVAPTTQVAPVEGAGTTVAAAGAPPPDRTLVAVREAYEETVMAMPHYVEEYDEPLDRHMRAEFGEEVATAVADGDRFTPALKAVLLQRARHAAADRDRLISRLDDEADELDAAAEELSRLGATIEEAAERPLNGRSYDQLVDEWHRLGEVEARLRRLLDDRQGSLDPDADARGPPYRPSLQGYLYAALDSHYPVLADGSVLADRIKTARSRVLHALTRRA